MQDPNNIREDLDLFNQIADLFPQDELDSPVANYINPENLLKDLDLSLNDNPSVEEEFKKNLKKLILSTPKSSSKLFLISFLEEDIVRGFWRFVSCCA